ncbi:unnamed protein product [Symbiodinium natans]|uniref:Cyclic nucleotide-binding domain-containing protein n=1 Tax=Symbiodinium natans TaxID=878477 RepID=A0A812R1E1_9DINO|nr:unnamed protein product [Symbiodinium natans]
MRATARRLLKCAPLGAPLAVPLAGLVGPDADRSVRHPEKPVQLRSFPQVRCSTTGEREFAYIHEHNFDDRMWSIAGKVDFLGLMEEGSYLFKHVPSDVIHRLSFGQKVFARKGTVLIEEGSENSALFVVGYGNLAISVHGEEIATVGPGQVIGLYTMLKGTMASASVIVSSELAYILELRHSHFMACLDDNPDVKNRMQVLLEQREAQNKAAEMISKKTVREV